MKTVALEKLSTFGEALEQDRVCPVKACKLLDAAMRLVAPADVVEADPVIAEPVVEAVPAPIAPVADPVPSPTVQIEPGPEVEKPASPEGVEVVDSEMSDLETVLRLLDPANDDHWTKAGLPSIKEVESLLGQDVSRDDVSAAIEGYDRETASAN